MKQVLLLLFVSLFFVNDSQAQYITQEKGSLSKKRYVQNGIELSNKRQIFSALESNPQAYDQINSAYGLKKTSSIIKGIGVSVSLLGVNFARTNEKTGIVTMLAGLGIITLSVPISISSKSKIKKAINLYNEDYSAQDTGMKHSPTLNLQTNSNGVGLVLAF